MIALVLAYVAGIVTGAFAVVALAGCIAAKMYDGALGE